MAGDKKFFLGIHGQQSGPHSEDEVRTRIQSGEARAETLVWYEGLAEWQRLDSIIYFQASFDGSKQLSLATAPADSSASATASKKSEGRSKGGETPPPLRPVFSTEQAVIYRPKGPRPEVLVLGGLFLALGLGTIVYMSWDSEESGRVAAVQVAPSPAAQRAQRFVKADSDYTLNPSVIPADYSALLKENSDDEIGKKSFAALEGIYKKKFRHAELASLYLEAKRYSDALPPLMELRRFNEAENAAFSAYQNAKEPAVRRAMLTKSIEMLTNQVPNPQLALERIRILEKEFPAEKHSFGYYLLTEDRKMADLFERTSFFFVESLLHHIKSEFPQIKLAGRPLVKIVKDPAGFYRITGSYQGEVSLSQDKLKDIRFEYWMVGSEWSLVGTNVTVERREWSQANRVRHANSGRSSAAMLAYLESVMRAQFPTLALHEKISREAMTSAARETASDQANQTKTAP
ncbi:DUF4339 domain-containing protein [bacterium]|nr:DUF4339 domain-containing protein [bacterium]